MNDLPDISSYSDLAILQEIGQFIKAKRVEQNITQDEVAERAAISRSTLSLMERGENIALTNLLKILRVLDALYVLEAFRVQPQISPMQMAREEQKRRKRASRSSSDNSKEELGW